MQFQLIPLGKESKYKTLNFRLRKIVNGKLKLQMLNTVIERFSTLDAYSEIKASGWTLVWTWYLIGPGHLLKIKI